MRGRRALSPCVHQLKLRLLQLPVRYRFSRLCSSLHLSKNIVNVTWCILRESTKTKSETSSYEQLRDAASSLHRLFACSNGARGSHYKRNTSATAPELHNVQYIAPPPQLMQISQTWGKAALAVLIVVVSSLIPLALCTASLQLSFPENNLSRMQASPRLFIMTSMLALIQRSKKKPIQH